MPKEKAELLSSRLKEKNLLAAGTFLIQTRIFSPENLGAVSGERGERLHQDTKEMERRHQGQWNANMMGDCCWTLHREIPETSHKRKSNIRSFAGKEKRQYKAMG
jgi:hypothetical protein